MSVKSIAPQFAPLPAFGGNQRQVGANPFSAPAQQDEVSIRFQGKAADAAKGIKSRISGALAKAYKEQPTVVTVTVGSAAALTVALIGGPVAGMASGLVTGTGNLVLNSILGAGTSSTVQTVLAGVGALGLGGVGGALILKLVGKGASAAAQTVSGSLSNADKSRGEKLAKQILEADNRDETIGKVAKILANSANGDDVANYVSMKLEETNLDAAVALMEQVAAIKVSKETGKAIVTASDAEDGKVDALVLPDADAAGKGRGKGGAAAKPAGDPGTITVE